MSLAGEIQEDFLEEEMPVVFGRRKGDLPPAPTPETEVSRGRECQVEEQLER